MDEKPEEDRGAAVPPVEDSARRVKAAASDIGDDLKSAAQDATDAAKGAAAQKVEELQHAAAEQTRSAASVLRETAETLNGDLPWMRQALTKTADGLDHLTHTIDRGDLNRTLDGVADFARRQPALFLGLSLAAGFALARVGKTAVEAGTAAVTSGEQVSSGAAVGGGRI